MGEAALGGGERGRDAGRPGADDRDVQHVRLAAGRDARSAMPLDDPRALRDRVAHERHARAPRPPGTGRACRSRSTRPPAACPRGTCRSPRPTWIALDRAGLLAARVADAAHAVDDGGGAADHAQHVALRTGGDARAAADAARGVDVGELGGRPVDAERRRLQLARAVAVVPAAEGDRVGHHDGGHDGGRHRPDDRRVRHRVRSGRPLPRTRASPRSRRPASTRRPPARTTGAGAVRSPTRGCAGPGGRR